MRIHIRISIFSYIMEFIVECEKKFSHCIQDYLICKYIWIYEYLIEIRYESFMVLGVSLAVHDTREWWSRVLQRTSTISYCTSATKVGVWSTIFIPSLAALSLLSNNLSLTLDSHRFVTILFLPPPHGLATKQLLWHAMVKRLLCVSLCRRKQIARGMCTRARACEFDKEFAKNAPRIFSCINSVFANKNNDGISKLIPKRVALILKLIGKRIS